MVKAGGKGNGTTSNKKAPVKTNRYCHHIFLTFCNNTFSTQPLKCKIYYEWTCNITILTIRSKGT